MIQNALSRPEQACPGWLSWNSDTIPAPIMSARPAAANPAAVLWLLLKGIQGPHKG